MTHDELLMRLFVTDKTNMTMEVIKWQLALRAVVELHKPELDGLICGECTASESEWYPCPTIQAIEKELE